MPTHAQVVITTPDRDVLALSRAHIKRLGERSGVTHHILENPVGVVLLLLFQLTSKIALIVKVLGFFCGSKKKTAWVMLWVTDRASRSHVGQDRSPELPRFRSESI